MENFTIHIFGYGETQIISKDLSFKLQSSKLATSKALVDAIWLKKPLESIAQEKYHAINIFNYDDVRWVSKDSFSLEKDQDLKPLIDALILELETLKKEEVLK